MVHAVVAHANPGDVLVLTSAEPAPIALVGELIATQAQVRGVAGILVDGAVRDLDELAAMGLPIWARFVRAQGATKSAVGKLDAPVVVGGADDPAGRPRRAWTATARWRCRARGSTRCCRSRSSARRTSARCGERYAAGELSYEMQGLREIVEELMEVAVLGLGEAGAGSPPTSSRPAARCAAGIPPAGRTESPTPTAI